MIEQVSRENGDSDRSLLVNGKRISGVNDIADYPVEAIERVEVLPPAAAARIGGTPGQRAYNVVLKRHFRNLTVTLGGQLATEGGWSSNRADTSFALIKGQDRINLSLRTTGNGLLLERDRDVLPVREPVPYSALGNVIPVSGAEIDPALSLQAGQPVSSVALTVFNARPSLSDLLAGANKTNPGNLSSFRSLRGANRTYEANLAGSKQLTPWLTASLNGRLNWANSTSLSGLPVARFQRDAGGHLIRVDGRTVNFDSQYTRDLRTALDLTVPLFGQAPRPPLKGKAAAPGPFSRPTLQLHAAHTWLLRSVTTIRAGLAQVDLLSGGAIGLAGGRPRHAFDGSVALAIGGNGLRLSGRWTGKSNLRVGTVTVPDQLSFRSFATFDVRVFADLGSLLPRSAMLRGTRVTLSAENLTNQRQRVTNSAGQVPTSFQSAYRDPVGRTVSMELRKVF